MFKHYLSLSSSSILSSITSSSTWVGCWQLQEEHNWLCQLPVYARAVIYWPNHKPICTSSYYTFLSVTWPSYHHVISPQYITIIYQCCWMKSSVIWVTGVRDISRHIIAFIIYHGSPNSVTQSLWIRVMFPDTRLIAE